MKTLNGDTVEYTDVRMGPKLTFSAQDMEELTLPQRMRIADAVFEAYNRHRNPNSERPVIEETKEELFKNCQEVLTACQQSLHTAVRLKLECQATLDRVRSILRVSSGENIITKAESVRLQADKFLHMQWLLAVEEAG